MNFVLVDELILIDDIEGCEKALEYKKNNLNQKIVCFGYRTHRHLRKLGVSHDFVEDYIPNNDRELIDNTTRSIMFSWYANSTIKDFLMYKNMNLGWLLENELYEYLLTIIKNFVGITRIIEKEMPKKIISTNSLCLIIKKIDQNNEIKIIEYVKTEHSGLAFDKIMIPFNFGF